MCLAVPGRVVAIDESTDPLTGLIDFGGVQKQACLEYLPDVRVGEYVIVHVGFALQRLDEESARASLELFEQLGLLEEEFGDAWKQAAQQAGGGAPHAPVPADSARSGESGSEAR
ncbi:HypC/HybG/HupF family hydrogenase formation chaperone [Streptomyces tropicalis]|uniref:HypC/HybG/HupF family hydrogenase formation chaperone n=1 Tax=Streptomyces tropicalis TaxID=3034234 RepID=A0ABT6A3S9_9ACTN|nr:HypC/HybG/HupF family hydrogenase formation chaperone [Streptomyces tropicalis]MDF3299046.1 HypC/HybG/HupF family hydrogenase formation chaperone [Streptomyces tropicalis]